MHQSLTLAERTLGLTLSLALILILLLQWQATMAPTEEPKWLALSLAGDILGLFGAFWALLACFKKSSPNLWAFPRKHSIFALGFLLFLIGLALGALYARNQGIALNRLSFWLSGSMILVTSAALGTFTAGRTLLSRSILFAAFFVSVDFWFHFFTDFQDPEYNKYVYFSSIGHFNFTADVLVILLPFGFWSFWIESSRGFKILSALTTLSLSLMLIMTGSLGGMGGILGGAALALILKLFSSKISLSFNKHWMPLVLSALLLALSAPWVLDRVPPDLRALLFHRAQWEEAPNFDTHPEGAHMPPLKDLWILIHPYLGSRTPMWASTSGMIEDRPWQGFGTGSFLFEYPAYQKRYDLFRDFETHGNHIKTNPHNVFLQIASENGLPMAFLFTALYCGLLIRCIRRSLTERDPLWLFGTWALTAAGLDAMVNHVFFNPASLSTIALATGLLHGGLEASDRPPDHAPRSMACWKALLLVLCVPGLLFLSSYPIRWVVSEHYVNEARLRLESRAEGSDFQAEKSYRKALSWFDDNVQAYLGLSGLLIRQKRFLDAEFMVNELLKRSPFQTQGLLIRARLEGDQGRLDDAERTLKEALLLEPDSSFLKKNLDRLMEFKKTLPPREGTAPQ